MNRTIALITLITLSVLAGALVIGSAAPNLATASTAASSTSTARTASTATVAAVAITDAETAVAVIVPAAPAVAPAHASAAATVQSTPSAAAPAASATSGSAAPSTTDTRTAYINAMYVAVVPAYERAALAGHYVLGYNLAGLNCGTGCTGLFSGEARSSFNATFFSESVAYQRSRIAHEAAHAYGFLHFTNYSTPSWAGIAGWQSQFNSIDRSFALTYDAEAWAACVAWQETGFNNVVNQIAHACTASAATLAMSALH